MQPPEERSFANVANSLKIWLSNLAGIVWLAAMELVIFSTSRHWLAGVGLGLAAMILGTIAALELRWSSQRRPFIVLGAVVLGATSFGAIFFSGAVASTSSLVVRQLPAHVLSLASGILLTAWLHHGQRQVADPLRGRFAVFVMTVSLWAGLFSVLSWVIFMGLSPWWLPVVGSLLAVGASWVVWQDAGVPFRTFGLALLPTAILGAETTLVVWWLPTALPVGATVGTTVLALFIQVNRHIWLNSWHHGRGRRYLWAGALIVIFSLLSARWI